MTKIAGKSRQENSFDLTRRQVVKRLVSELFDNGAIIDPLLKLLGWLWLELPSTSETATTRHALEKLISRAYLLTDDPQTDGEAAIRYAVSLVREHANLNLTQHESVRTFVPGLFAEVHPDPLFFKLLAWLKDATPEFPETFKFHGAIDGLIAVSFSRSEAFYDSALNYAASLLKETESNESEAQADDLSSRLASLRLEITRFIMQYPEDSALESRLRAMLAAARGPENEERAPTQSDFDELARTLKALLDNPATPEGLSDVIGAHLNNANPITDRHLVDAFMDSLRE